MGSRAKKITNDNKLSLVIGFVFVIVVGSARLAMCLFSPTMIVTTTYTHFEDDLN